MRSPQNLTPQIIFGALKAEGKLPIRQEKISKQEQVLKTLVTSRLSYGMPAEVGMSIDSLRRIDDIIEAAIKDKATPGAQIIVARKGKVIYQKNYGYQTYAEEKAIDDHSIYDVHPSQKWLPPRRSL